MTMTRAFLMSFCLAAGAAPAQAASFDCDRAVTAIEKAICANPELSALDDTMARYYRAAQETLPGAKACLLADQRTWLAQKRNRCADGPCLKSVYLDRLAELDKVQPARRDGEPMPLPARPFLTIIIPPTDQKPDLVESDPAQSTALEITGALKDSEGSFMVTPERGPAYALMNFYIEPPVLDQLHVAIATRDARFMVRGFAGKNRASGQAYFEPRRCIYIYQLPQ